MLPRDNGKLSNLSRVVIAAGGSGGHLFPAQDLARTLVSRGIEVRFAGVGLAKNRFFKRETFPFGDLSGARRSPIGLLKAIVESRRLLRQFSPDLVVGFGSYHAFPILCAALLKRVPIVLFESNSMPGKVNRLFSRFARYTAIQFPVAAHRLQGKTIQVRVGRATSSLSSASARAYFGLDPEKPTILIFGGSQGAVSVNELLCTAAIEIAKGGLPFQVIHLAGDVTRAEILRSRYEKGGVASCVKDFETQMEFAWQAASFAVCRSGAATIGEVLSYQVPALFIPFPHAADDHQTYNALFMEQEVGGAVHMPEGQADVRQLVQILAEFLDPSRRRLAEMKEKLSMFQEKMPKLTLDTLILEIFCE